MVNLRENTPTGSSGGADVAGHLYGFAALLASLVFVYKARVLHKLSRTANKIDKKAKDFFGFSIIYLFLLFSLLLADRLFFII